MDIQAQIPPALTAVHNFIRKHDPQEILEFQDILNDVPAMDSFGDLAQGPAEQAERIRAEATRDEIAEAMWQDYQRYLREME